MPPETCQVRNSIGIVFDKKESIWKKTVDRDTEKLAVFDNIPDFLHF